MRRLQQEGGGTFSVEELTAASEREGLTAKQVEGLFQMLRNQGEVAEIRTGRWQLVRF
jgi:hypothetical protein